MANKNNDTDYEVVLGIETKQAEKEVEEFVKKVNTTKTFINLQVSDDSTKKTLANTKETYTYEKKIGKYAIQKIKHEE